MLVLIGFLVLLPGQPFQSGLILAGKILVEFMKLLTIILQSLLLLKLS